MDLNQVYTNYINVIFGFDKNEFNYINFYYK